MSLVPMVVEEDQPLAYDAPHQQHPGRALPPAVGESGVGYAPGLLNVGGRGP